MPQHRHALPQLNDQTVLTDGGLETVLLFKKGFELPDFCAFPLLRTEEGRAALAEYLVDYLAIARRHGVTLLLESNTWRAHSDWVARLGFHESDAADLNREAIDLLVTAREANPDVQTVISGCIGPRGDGYVPTSAMTADQAHGYHRPQVETLARSEADLISALTFNYVEEATGLARAAGEAEIPCAISFTVETDGRLPTGQPLGEAIEQCDASCPTPPAYYMINCAHPKHFAHLLEGDAPWLSRVGGIRANASTKSHAELDEMTELDEGDPADLGERIGGLRRKMPSLNVLGGCCGTDHRHVASIAAACCDC